MTIELVVARRGTSEGCNVMLVKEMARRGKIAIIVAMEVVQGCVTMVYCTEGWHGA